MSTASVPSDAPAGAPSAAPVVRPFKSVAYAGTRSGTRLVVLGAVHGDETCGTRAIERLAAELDAGTLRIESGRLTLVPVANPLACRTACPRRPRT